MIKCILFDCDGTLVDSELLSNLGLAYKLKEYGITEPAHELLTRFRGKKLANTIASLEEKHAVKFDEDFIPSYRDYVNGLFEKDLQSCTGAAEMLSQITLPKCVVSNGPSAKIKKALMLTELAQFFDPKQIYSAYDINSWKPEPDLFLHAAKEMDFQPEECLVVEDTLLGIEAAKAANMESILYDHSNLYPQFNEVQKIVHLKELIGFIE